MSGGVPGVPQLSRLSRRPSVRRSTTRSCTVSRMLAHARGGRYRRRRLRSPLQGIQSATRRGPSRSGSVDSETPERLISTSPVESLERAVDQDAPWRSTGSPTSGMPYRAHVEESQGFSVVREFVGHGIGTVAARGPAGAEFRATGARCAPQGPGLVLAIEPMVNVGTVRGSSIDADGWTARTKDGSLIRPLRVLGSRHRDVALEGPG